MSVVLSMFNHHSKLLARSSYTTPALLVSSTGSILLSCLLPSHLFPTSLTIWAFLKQANCNQCFGCHLMTSKCVHQSRSADLCIQMLTRPFGYLCHLTFKMSKTKMLVSPSLKTLPLDCQSWMMAPSFTDSSSLGPGAVICFSFFFILLQTKMVTKF